MSADDHTRRLATANPTGWFEDLYVEAEAGTASVPWDVPTPQPHLVEWASGVSGDGRRALVVGCGYGRDSEFLASLGFDVVAFDISPTGIAAVRARHPQSKVSYEVADLLNPPAAWHRAFDLVVENMTVQALPISLHAQGDRAGGVVDRLDPAGAGRGSRRGPRAGRPAVAADAVGNQGVRDGRTTRTFDQAGKRQVGGRVRAMTWP